LIDNLANTIINQSQGLIRVNGNQGPISIQTDEQTLLRQPLQVGFLKRLADEFTIKGEDGETI